MKTHRFLEFLVVALLVAGPAAAQTPVPLPCDPEDCPRVDPCQINPQRCEPQPGPIEEPDPDPAPDPPVEDPIAPTVPPSPD